MALASCFVEALQHVEDSFLAGRIDSNQRAAARNSIHAEAAAGMNQAFTQVERDVMLRKMQHSVLREAQLNAVAAHEKQMALAEAQLLQAAA